MSAHAPVNRPRYCRAAAKCLVIVLLIGALFAPVSADEIIYDYEMSENVDTSVTGYVLGQSTSYAPGAHNRIIFQDIQKFQNVAYISFTIPGNQIRSYQGDVSGEPLPSGVHNFEWSLPNQNPKTGRIYVSRITDVFGTVVSTTGTIFFDDWDVSGLSGLQYVTTNIDFANTQLGTGAVEHNEVGVYFGFHNPIRNEVNGLNTYFNIAAYSEWQNHLTVNKLDDFPLGGYTVTLKREYSDIQKHFSDITIYNGSNVVYYHTGATDFSEWFGPGTIDMVTVLSSLEGKTYRFPLTAGAPPTLPGNVTIYIKSSQTGALLADAHINISASVNGTLHEVINETIPSGIATYTLQPTGGGMPNPDFYRLITTVEGYISVMPYMDFEVDGATITIYDYLDPIAGAPEDENKTFIDFYVKDLTANAISGATVNFGGYRLITNSAGYAVFEVDKNNSYTWTVSKSGYGSLTGNAVIGDKARHTINAVIAPAVTPTTTTPIPTSTSISPTPTMTAPTGEPTSNLLEWFAAHFGMLLGGGVEIGKIFMWLCFTVPVGVYVGKEAKAGAAGFMAGAGIVTLFFVLIGWVPVWLVVLLALIIGLLYAKVFNTQDNGGGR